MRLVCQSLNCVTWAPCAFQASNSRPAESFPLPCVGACGKFQLWMYPLSTPTYIVEPSVVAQSDWMTPKVAWTVLVQAHVSRSILRSAPSHALAIKREEFAVPRISTSETGFLSP